MGFCVTCSLTARFWIHCLSRSRDVNKFVNSFNSSEIVPVDTCPTEAEETAQTGACCYSDCKITEKESDGNLKLIALYSAWSEFHLRFDCQLSSPRAFLIMKSRTVNSCTMIVCVPPSLVLSIDIRCNPATLHVKATGTFTDRMFAISKPQSGVESAVTYTISNLEQLY